MPACCQSRRPRGLQNMSTCAEADIQQYARLRAAAAQEADGVQPSGKKKKHVPVPKELVQAAKRTAAGKDPKRRNTKKIAAPTNADCDEPEMACEDSEDEAPEDGSAPWEVCLSVT